MTTEEDIRRQALWAQGEKLTQTGCWEHDLATGELIWSDNLFRIYGDDPGAVEPSFERVLLRTHPDDRARLGDAVRALHETGEPRVIDHRIVRPNGDRRYVRATITVGDPADGGPDRLVGIVQDLTDSIHAEREIAAHVAVEESLAAWEDLGRGAHRLMGELITALDCDAGIFWVPCEAVLVARVFWSGATVDGDALQTAARAASPHRGIGVPGRAWASGLPEAAAPGDAASAAWAGDAAPPVGGVAIPAVDGRSVLAVVELKRDREIVLSERLMRSLCGISHELGHFLARRGGELAAPLLTPREIEVLQLAAEGLAAAQTAIRLKVGTATIRTHLANIYAKLLVADRSSAVATAMRLGIID
jgi:DNA-binding CsgD family transcriptional regulator